MRMQSQVSGLSICDIDSSKTVSLNGTDILATLLEELFIPPNSDKERSEQALNTFACLGRALIFCFWVRMQIETLIAG